MTKHGAEKQACHHPRRDRGRLHRRQGPRLPWSSAGCLEKLVAALPGQDVLTPPESTLLFFQILPPEAQAGQRNRRKVAARDEKDTGERGDGP